MTTPAFTPTPSYTVSGTGPYQIGHAYSDGADLAVAILDGGETALALGTDFTVSPAAHAAGGDLTLSAAAAAAHAGKTLIIRRNTPAVQDWQGTTAREIGLERTLDRIARAVQDGVGAFAKRAYDILTDGVAHHFALGKQFRFSTDGGGYLAPSIIFRAETDVARAGVAFEDHTGQIVAHLYYHFEDVTSGNIHNALEVKTRDAAGNQVTREALTANEDAARKDFYNMRRINMADPTGRVFARFGIDNDAPEELMVLNPDSNDTCWWSAAGVADFGYDDAQASAFVRAGSGKALEYYVNNNAPGNWAWRTDSDGRTRFNRHRRDRRLSFAQLAGLAGDDAPADGDQAWLTDAFPADIVYGAPVVKTGTAGLRGTPIHYDGTSSIWRFG